MDTIHERRPDHEMQLFWMEQAGVLAEIQGEYKGRRSYWDDGKHRIPQTTPKVPRRKGKRLKEGQKEQRSAVWLHGTQKRERLGTGESERFRGDRKETVGIAPPPQQSERELKLPR